MRRGVATALAAAATMAGLILLDASPLRSAAPPAGDEARSLEAYGLMASTLMSPGCQNCHTLTSFPRQDDDGHAHAFNVMRGPDDHGAAGLPCSTCHGPANNAAGGVPGAAEGVATLTDWGRREATSAARAGSGGDAGDGFPLRHGVQAMEMGGEGGAARAGRNEVIADDGEDRDEALQAAG